MPTANFEPYEEAALSAWLKIAEQHPRYRYLNGRDNLSLEGLTRMNSNLADKFNRQNSIRIAAEINGLLSKRPEFIPALYTARFVKMPA